MSFFSNFFFGNERCDECGGSTTAKSSGMSSPWDAAWIFPFDRRVDELRRLLDLRPAGADAICREDPHSNQMECQMYPGRGFRPENVEVNVRGRQVEMHARQEDKSDDGQSYSLHEIRRTFTIPENADVEQLTASMEPDGRFILRAPLLKSTAINNDGSVPIIIKRS